MESNIFECLTELQKKRVIHYESIDSTNKELKKAALNGAEPGTVIIADEQTAGNGRLGRRFVSPKQKGIYMSLLVSPSECPLDNIPLTSLTAVAVNNAIENVTGVRCGIKWVNDIVINRKKICGILTESLITDGKIKYIIIGIGVNVNTTISEFPDDITEKASSLLIETSKKISRSALISEIIKEIDVINCISTENRNMYLNRYRKDSVTVGREVKIINGVNETKGFAQCINDDFSLCVRLENGELQNINSGEISVRGLYDYI